MEHCIYNNYGSSQNDAINIKTRNGTTGVHFVERKENVPQYSASHSDGICRQKDNLSRSRILNKITTLTNDSKELQYHKQYTADKTDSFSCICSLLGRENGHFPNCSLANAKDIKSLDCESHKISKDSTATDPRRVFDKISPGASGNNIIPEKADGWKTLSCVAGVASLGYSIEEIGIAVTNLRMKCVSDKELSTDAILDELFLTECDTDDGQSTETQSNFLSKETNLSANSKDNYQVKNTIAADIKEKDTIAEDTIGEDTIEQDTTTSFDAEPNGPQPATSHGTPQASQENETHNQASNTISSENQRNETETKDEVAHEMQRLQKQNDALKSTLTCKVCLDATVGELFLPCRHLVCCVNCSASVQKCPVCREHIVGTIKTFV